MHIKNQVVLNQKSLTELTLLLASRWSMKKIFLKGKGIDAILLIKKGDSSGLRRTYISRYHITFLRVVFPFLLLWENLTELYQLQGYSEVTCSTAAEAAESVWTQHLEAHSAFSRDCSARKTWTQQRALRISTLCCVCASKNRRTKFTLISLQLEFSWGFCSLAWLLEDRTK